MKAVAALMLLMLTIPLADACIVEYSEVEYALDSSNITAPYVSNFSQSLGEAIAILNFTNPYNFTVFDLYITYKNVTFYLPVISPGQSTVSMDKNLVYPEAFEVLLSVDVSGNSRLFSIKYTIHNNHTYPVHVVIAMPRPSWLSGCRGCTKTPRVEFASTIPPKNSEGFILIGSGSTVRVPSATIEFSIVKEARLTVGVPLNPTVSKENVNGAWMINFSTRNPYGIVVNLTAVGLIDYGEPPHSINRSSVVFTENVLLYPGEVWSKTVSVNATSPGAFLRLKATNASPCRVLSYPATSIENSLVGYGIIKGFTLRLPPYIPLPPSNTSTVPPTTTETTTSTTLPSASSVPTTTTPTSTTTIPTTTSNSQPPENKTPTPSITVLKPPIPPTNTSSPSPSNFPEVPKPNVVVEILLRVPAFLTALVVPIAGFKKPIVIDPSLISPENIERIRGPIYLPPSALSKGILISDFVIVHPNRAITKYLKDRYGISEESAELIALAIEYGADIYLTEKKAVVVALGLGLDVFYVEGKK